MRACSASASAGRTKRPVKPTAADGQSGRSALRHRPSIGSESNMTQRQLDELTRDECLNLLRRKGVGRLVYQDDVGPIAEPVNYAVAGEDIVVRVQGGAKRAATSRPSIAFEVDRIDEELH